MSSFAKLTPARAEILRLIETEGAVHRGDVAELFRRNVRTAVAQLNALHRLGLIEPIRICEFRLSKTGQQWLDNFRRPL